MNGTVIVTWLRSGSTCAGSCAELLDDREDVVPAAGVEPDDAVAQRVEDLVHLVRGEDGLDEHGRPGCCRTGSAEAALQVGRARRPTTRPRGGSRAWAGTGTGPLPPRRGTAAAEWNAASVTSNSDAPTGRAVDGDVALHQVQAARADDERGDLGGQPVDACRRAGEVRCRSAASRMLRWASRTLPQWATARPRCRP